MIKHRLYKMKTIRNKENIIRYKATNSLAQAEIHRGRGKGVTRKTRGRETCGLAVHQRINK